MRPISAICCQVASLKPRSSSIRVRTARGVLSRLKNSRVRSRSIVCSWLKSKSIALRSSSSSRDCGPIRARLAGQLQHTLADDVFLNFRRPGVNRPGPRPEIVPRPRAAVAARRGRIQRERRRYPRLELAVRSEHLQHQVLMAFVHLAVVQLVDRRLGTRSLALLQLAQNAQAGIAQHLDLDDHAAQLLADHRVLQGRLAVAAEVTARVEQALHIGLVARHPGKHAAATFETERRLRELPALALLANDVLHRNLHIGKEDLSKLGTAGDLLQWPDFHARRVHVQDEIRDALVLGNVRIRAGEQHAVVGDRPQAGPDLLAIDDVVLAVVETLADGFRLQAGEVGPGIRLGIQLTPDVLGRQDAADVLLLLRLRAVGNQGWPDDAQAQAVDRPWHIAAGHLLGHDRLFQWSGVLTAVLARPTHADHAGLVERALPRLALRERFQWAGRVCFEPLADAQAKGFILSRVFKIHSDPPGPSCRIAPPGFPQ